MIIFSKKINKNRKCIKIDRKLLEIGYKFATFTVWPKSDRNVRVTKNENFRRKKWMVRAPLARGPSIFSAENFHFSSQKIGRSPIFAHFLLLFGLNGKSNKLILDFQSFSVDFYKLSTFIEFFTKKTTLICTNFRCFS